MPTTIRQKKARKSRGLETFSDIENLDIMLGGGDHFDTLERDESLNNNLARKPESVISNDLENDQENTHVDPRVINSGSSAEFDRNSTTAYSSAEINRLSSELNSRIPRETDKIMNSVSVQIQRAINDDISNQVLPQIQNVINSGSGQVTKNGWDIPSERPEVNSEGLRSGKARNDMKTEQAHGRQFYDHYDDRNDCDTTFMHLIPLHSVKDLVNFSKHLGRKLKLLFD